MENHLLILIQTELCLERSWAWKETLTQKYRGNFKIKPYLNDGSDMNRCFHFASMLLDHWVGILIRIDVSLHPYFSSPTQVWKQRLDFNSPVLFSVLQQLHSPSPWLLLMWVHLGLWPWKHILQTSKEKQVWLSVHIHLITAFNVREECSIHYFDQSICTNTDSCCLTSQHRITDRFCGLSEVFDFDFWLPNKCNLQDLWLNWGHPLNPFKYTKMCFVIYCLWSNFRM